MKKGSTILAILLIALPALAQEDNQLVPAEVKYRTLVNDPMTLPKGYLRTTVYGYSSLVNKFFDADGEKKIFFENIWNRGFDLGLLAMYGITDRLQVELSTGYRNTRTNGSVHFEQGTIFSVKHRTEYQVNGLDDTELGLIYQVMKEDITGSGLAVYAGVMFPTGSRDFENYSFTIDLESYDYPTGSGEFALKGKLWYRKGFFPFSLDLFVDYKYGLGGSKIYYAGDESESDFEGSSLLAFSANFNAQLNDWIAFRQQLYYGMMQHETLAGVDPESGSALVYTPFVSFQIRQFRITQGVQFPLMGKLYPGDMSYTVLLSYIF